MICNCAVCGEQMEATKYAVITENGLVNNLCCDECIKIYNNSDVVIEQAISTKEVKNER